MKSVVEYQAESSYAFYFTITQLFVNNNSQHNKFMVIIKNRILSSYMTITIDNNGLMMYD